MSSRAMELVLYFGRLITRTWEPGEQVQAESMVAAAFFPIRQKGGFNQDKHQSSLCDRAHGTWHTGIRVWFLAALRNWLDDLKRSSVKPLCLVPSSEKWDSDSILTEADCEDR